MVSASIVLGLAVLLVPFFILFLLSIVIIQQFERGVKFTLGRFSSVLEPGLNFVIPIIQTVRTIDVRTTVIDVPQQETMTKDNVSVKINAVIYYRVSDPQSVVLNVQNYVYATTQLAQTTMRDVVGEVSLNDLLGSREAISNRIQDIVAKATAEWGIRVENVELKDIELPADLIRVIAKEAEAEREKRAVIIRASGEAEAAKSLAKAAEELSSVPGGLHIRMLQTINNLGSEKSNTSVLTTPSEVLQALLNWAKK
jgi:regulator of protease activity HflC (stomatin/prohibitin superfamily)